MDRGGPFEPYRQGGPPSMSPLCLSLDPPGGPQGEGPPPVLPLLQQQLLQHYRSQRLWLQRVVGEPSGSPRPYPRTQTLNRKP